MDLGDVGGEALQERVCLFVRLWLVLVWESALDTHESVLETPASVLDTPASVLDNIHRDHRSRSTAGASNLCGEESIY